MAATPKVDPSKLLAKLESLIKSNSVSKDVAHGGKAHKGKSWVWSLIIPLLVLAGVAAFTWFASSRNRELAKLRHEKFKRKIMADKAEADAEIAKKASLIALAEEKIVAEKKKLRLIEADIRAEEKRYEADLAAIDSIRSWADAGIR